MTMPRKPAAPAAVPILLQRRTVFAACIVVVAVTVVAFAGVASDLILVRLLTDGSFLLAWLAAGAGLGSLFFRLPGRRTPAVSRVERPLIERIDIPGREKPLLHDAVGPGSLMFITAIALGLGVIGLAT